MYIRSIITIVFFFALNNKTMCQEIGNFLPLAINGLTPSWIHYSYDSTIVGHVIPDPRALNTGFDGMGHVYIQIPAKLIIKDGYWYKISNTLYDADISGGLIEKIDLNTGKRIWYDAFDKRTQTYRESVHHAEILNDTLWVYSIKITKADSPSPLPVVALFRAKGVLKVRAYDLRTGEVIIAKEADPNDEKVRVLKSGFHNEIIINQIKNDQFHILEQKYDDVKIGAYIVSDTINGKGIRVNPSDTILSLYQGVNWADSYAQDWHKIWKDDDENLYWIDFYVPDDDSFDPSRAVLRIFAKDGNYREIDLDQYNALKDAIGWHIVDVRDGKILIVTEKFDEKLKFTVINDETGIKYLDGDYPGIFYETSLNNDGSVLVFNNRPRDDEQMLWYFDFYALKPTEMENISSFHITHKDYFLTPSKVVQLDNGDFLLSFLFTQYNNFSFKGRFMTDVRISPKMINFISGINQTESSHFIKIDITPNPVMNIATFKNVTSADTYKLYSISGQLIKEGIYHENVEMGNLSSGLYFIHLIKNEKIIGSTGLFVKI